jgi:hypothetical protein
MALQEDFHHKAVPAIEFKQILVEKIRINHKNLILRSKLSITEDESYDATLIRALENSYRKHKKLRNYAHSDSDQKNNLRLDPGSSFILFMLKKKHYRDVMPDIELTKYKEVCVEMISKLGSCDEAHFGLAKLLVHEANYEQAEQHLVLALAEEKHSYMYNMWLGVIKSLSAKSKLDLIYAKQLCECKS